MAGRYLNPLRNTVSVITLVLVAGVALGVTTLLTVLSVMNGFEKEIKSRIVGFTPHVTLTHFNEYGEKAQSKDWDTLLETLAKNEEVESGYGLVEGYVLAVIGKDELPMRYRSVDPSNESQMADLKNLVDSDNYPEGNADLGFEPEGVFSASMLKRMGLQVGDKITIYSSSNFGEVKAAYEVLDQESAYQQYAGLIDEIHRSIAEAKKESGEFEIYPRKDVEDMKRSLGLIYDASIREFEKDVIYEAYDLLESAEGEPDSLEVSLAKGSAVEIQGFLQSLKEVTQDQLDAADDVSLRELKSVALPRDLVVKGAYKASGHVTGPDVFIPLVLGRELKDFEEGEGLEQIALRLKDPYAANTVVETLKAQMPQELASWDVRPWMSDYIEWLTLVGQEKTMMSFVLSIVMVIVTFCIGAVMFTVTIQKKQEVGVMKALGATESQIMNVFLIQGVIVGVIGVVSGWLGAWALLSNRTAIQQMLATVFNFDPFPAGVHGISAIPMEFSWVTFSWVSIAAFLLCIFAALIPARVAARNDPARSLRGL